MKCIKILSVAVFCVIILKGGGNLWAFSLFSSPPMPEALEALAPDEWVDVVREPVPMIWNLWNMFEEYYTFKPRDVDYTKGFIFYPGGLVDYRSYAPLAREIALRGYLVVMVKMPLDMALFGFQRAEFIHNKHPEVEMWAIGGHSLGGVAACRFVREKDGLMDGVVLWASYPSETYRLDKMDIAVTSIYGTKDGLSTVDKIEDSKQHLPRHTEFVEIPGGNHTQFGWYVGSNDGLQRGDNPADISRLQQQEEIVRATAEFLDRL